MTTWTLTEVFVIFWFFLITLNIHLVYMYYLYNHILIDWNAHERKQRNPFGWEEERKISYTCYTTYVQYKVRYYPILETKRIVNRFCSYRWRFHQESVWSYSWVIRNSVRSQFFLFGHNYYQRKKLSGKNKRANALEIHFLSLFSIIRISW